MKPFEIFFRDLTPDAQSRLLQAFQTTEEEENWHDIPLAIIEREEDECQ